MAAGALPKGTKQVTAEKKLKALLGAGRSMKQDVGEIVDGFNTAVAKAVEKDHLDRRAFNIVRTLDRLEPEKLAATLDNLDHYLEAGGLRERAASAPSMNLDDSRTELEVDEAEQTRAASRNGAAKNGEGEKSSEKPSSATASDGNVKNFPTPQGRA